MPVLIHEEDYGINRDKLNSELKNYNIITRKYFYPICSEFQCYQNNATSSLMNLPVSFNISRKILILPLYKDLEIEDIDHICDAIEYISKKNKHQRSLKRNVYHTAPFTALPN
jgi:dTDP-4-amino-4,6-dideoxygalactose transaminase